MRRIYSAQLLMNAIKAIWSALEYPLTIIGKSKRNLNDYQIHGNSVQDGTPTPDVPVAVESVGELVASGMYAGKYKVGVKITSGTTAHYTNIFLDAPLRKIGDYADYIDYKNKRVVRRVGELILTGNESFSVQSAFESDNTYLFILSSATTNRHGESTWGGNRDLCNYLKRSSSSIQTSTSPEGFNFNPSAASRNALYLRLNKSRLSAGTRQAVQAWLKEFYNNGTPLKVYYAFEESVYEPTDNIPALSQFKGTTVYEAETTITPSGIQVKYY